MARRAGRTGDRVVGVGADRVGQPRATRSGVEVVEQRPASRPGCAQVRGQLDRDAEQRQQPGAQLRQQLERLAQPARRRARRRSRRAPRARRPGRRCGPARRGRWRRGRWSARCARRPTSAAARRDSSSAARAASSKDSRVSRARTRDAARGLGHGARCRRRDRPAQSGHRQRAAGAARHLGGERGPDRGRVGDRRRGASTGPPRGRRTDAGRARRRRSLRRTGARPRRRRRARRSARSRISVEVESVEPRGVLARPSPHDVGRGLDVELDAPRQPAEPEGLVLARPASWRAAPRPAAAR